MTTIIWAPGDLIVASNGGVEVRLAGVRTNSEVPFYMGHVPDVRGIRVDLVGVTSRVTMDLDIAYTAAIESWILERKSHGQEAAGARPLMPGGVVLSAVKPAITDNHDTDYRLVASHSAGTGTEWDGSWFFVPEPPAAVKHLTIEFTVNGRPTGKSCRVQLD